MTLILVAAVLASGPGPTLASWSNVGTEGHRRNILIPGALLETRPPTSRSRLEVWRESAVKNGDGYIYDFGYVGHEPDIYDLRDYLVRADGSPLGGIDPIPIEIAGLLPPGNRAELILPELPAPSPRGGYSNVLKAIAATWLVLAAVWVTLVCLAWLRRAKIRRALSASAAPDASDEVRRLIRLACEVELSVDSKLRLERLLFAVWCRRLGWCGRSPEDVSPALARDERIGPKFMALTSWLYGPPGPFPPELAREYGAEAESRAIDHFPPG